MVGNVAYDISYMTVRGTIHRVKATRGSDGDLDSGRRALDELDSLRPGRVLSGEQHPITQVVNPVWGQMPIE
jgi:hypothetical protein